MFAPAGRGALTTLPEGLQRFRSISRPRPSLLLLVASRCRQAHLLQQADSLTVCSSTLLASAHMHMRPASPQDELPTHAQRTQPGDVSHTRETACEQLPPSLTACWDYWTTDNKPYHHGAGGGGRGAAAAGKRAGGAHGAAGCPARAPAAAAGVADRAGEALGHHLGL